MFETLSTEKNRLLNFHFLEVIGLSVSSRVLSVKCSPEVQIFFSSCYHTMLSPAVLGVVFLCMRSKICVRCLLSQIRFLKEDSFKCFLCASAWKKKGCPVYVFAEYVSRINLIPGTICRSGF